MEKVLRSNLPADAGDAVIYVTSYIGYHISDEGDPSALFESTEFLYNFRILKVAIEEAERFQGIQSVLEEIELHLSDGWHADVRALFRKFQLLVEAESIRDHFDGQEPYVPSTDVIFAHQSDSDEILEICKDIRRITNASVEFENQHKIRILRALNKIEIEVYRRQGPLSRFLSAVRDISETAEEVGKDVEPLIDQAERIVKIARNASEDIKGIDRPEEIKQLPSPNQAEAES